MNAAPETSGYAEWRPGKFFEIRVHDTGLDPTLLALCASFDNGRWRADEFCDFLFDYLPEFALSYSELKQFTSGTGRRMIRQAAKTIYKSEKFSRRGEFGELILHAALREALDTEPAISKLFFKSSLNQTVHGFDSVHVAFYDDKLHLLVGEVKFYASVAKAIAAVADELKAHLVRDYMREECMLITNRLDDAWPHTTALRKLIDERRPLDEIFADIRVPVLLTYDSVSVSGHTAPTTEYLAALEDEVRRHHKTFADCDLPGNVAIDLILVPLLKKKDFVKELDRKLRLWQTL